MLTPERRDELVSELAGRPGHEKVRVLLHRLLVDGLGADSRDVRFEQQAPEVHGRIDALLGRTVFELKSDLRREGNDAEDGLTRYLSEREGQTGEKFVGIATDGADFTAYFLRGGSVVEVGAHRTDPENSWETLAWLRSTVAIGEDLLPDPETIAREFGRESLAARRALDDLEGLWEQVAETPDARLKRELWNRLLSLAYGAEVGDDSLFLQHSYLVIVAKAAAWAAMIEAPPQDADAILHGAAFANYGVTGQSEPDFFDWVLEAEGGPALVMRIARQVNRFRLHDIRVDILKALYESLIDPEARHDLGEYYTPDWLAARMVATTVDRPLEQRVMDPACGSGTFLFQAVKAILGAAEAAGLGPAEAAKRAADNVAGIDIHPVAVIFARVTFLLALMPALREGHPGNLALPVYLGDALQWNRPRPGENGEHPDMFADADTLEIYVPPLTVQDPIPQSLGAATLRFPAEVASDSELFDRVLNTMIEFGARSEPARNFRAWLERDVSVLNLDRDILCESYEVMRRLQGEGRNHIWGYVARNLARPVWLSSEDQKADVVIGNPPWVAYRYMSTSFQRRFRAECGAAQLWVGGKVATQQDLSGYFYMRSALLYMRKSGRIALVMPYAALSRLAYRGFRRGEVVWAGYVEFRLRFTEAWTFGPEVQPLFPVPSGVLIAEVHDGVSSAPLPNKVRAFEGKLPRRDADEAEADRRLTESLAPWPTEASDEGGSPYRGAFRQGATLVPRRLVIVEPAPQAGRLPPSPDFPIVRGRIGNQDKKPWKELVPPQGPVDKEFLRPALLGESVAPFRLLEAPLAVIPWNDERDELMDANKAIQRGYLRLTQWLETTEELWEKHKQSAMTHLERIDYHGELSCQFPIAPIRAVYSASGTIPAACVVREPVSIVESKLYWARMESLQEARYLCAILNSEALRVGVKEYQSQGQWGARDFHKYVFNLPIPRFDKDNALHQRLARAAGVAERVANDVPLNKGEYFVRTRKRVRAALAEHGVAERLEELVGELLGGV
ncbi:MAG: N-6 DNA methylase [Rhodospirillaceae bacterium]|nr:N-6 DNA methylase [Rhodospirillaceae bacterium]